MSRPRKDLLYSKKKKIPEKLLCSICLDVIFNAKKLNCPHTFCGECIDNWSSRGNQCPLCRTKFRRNDIKDAKDLCGEVENLNVFCRFDNCPWMGPIKNVIKHEDVCVFSPDKTDKKILDALPKYEKDEDDIFTPDVSVLTTLFKEHRDLAVKLITDKSQKTNVKSKGLKSSSNILCFQRSLDEFIN